MNQERYCACPYCEAVFRLPDSKFKRKEGIVRCGACRSVFDSNVNLVRRSDAGFEPVSDNKPGPIKPASTKPGSSNSEPLKTSTEARVTTPHTRSDESRGDIGEDPELDENLAVTQYPEQDLEFTAPAYSWDNDLKSEISNEESIRDVPIDDVENPFA